MTSQYLYRVQLNRPEILSEGPTEQEAEVLQAHASYVDELANQSKVLLAGRTQAATPEAFGIVIIAATTEADAQAIMRNDPAVMHGVMRGELFPYQIAFMAPDIQQHL